MTVLNKFKYKVLAAVMAAGMVFGVASIPAFAATTGTSTATVEFTGGELELIGASSVTFTGGDVTSAEQNLAATGPMSIQVADNRGTEAGWTLTGQLGNFYLASDPTTPVLVGSSINVSSASMREVVTGNPSDAPTAVAPLSLLSGSPATNVAVAEEDEGAGGWYVDWATGAITLNVPGDTAPSGTAVATMTWSIQAAL